jgi:uncharacterized membrane protein
MSKLRIAAIVIFLVLAVTRLVSYFQQRQAEPAAQLDTYGEKMTDEVRIARDALIQSGNMTAAEFDERLRAMKSTAEPADRAALKGSAK